VSPAHARIAASLPRALLLAFLLLLPVAAHAADPQDDILRHVGVDEKLGAQVPRTCRSPTPPEAGPAGGLPRKRPGPPHPQLLHLSDALPLTFRSLAATMERMKGFSLARDYRVVTVSIDPGEIPEIARAKANETHGLMPGVRTGTHGGRSCTGVPNRSGGSRKPSGTAT